MNEPDDLDVDAFTTAIESFNRLVSGSRRVMEDAYAAIARANKVLAR